MTSTLDRTVERVRHEYDDLAAIARTDAVTGLPNRTHFAEVVSKVLPPADETACAILFIDLDRFKSVNDSLGHKVGDELLREFSRRMLTLLGQECMEEQRPVFARLAGDEFTIFLQKLDGIEPAEQLAEKILLDLEMPFLLDEHQLTLGASIGVASTCGAGGRTDNLRISCYDRLMQQADTAMYRAKEEGRNRLKTFANEMHDNALERLELENCLRGAAQAGEFTLHLQPLVKTGSGVPVAAEALLRWNHPEHGLLLPGSFVEVAEDTGLIVEIGDWVLKEAVALSGRLASAEVPMRIAVNVSLRQMEASDFISKVEAAIADSGGDPSLIEIEITESLIMRNAADTAPKLAHLRALGMSVAIDDFGTGYSNLARLKSLPIDRLKVDRSLIKDLALSSSARTIVQAILSLAHGLGYESVVEGIETPVQKDIISVIGCNLLQGFGIAAPMTEAAFIEWAKARGGASPAADDDDRSTGGDFSIF